MKNRRLLPLILSAVFIGCAATAFAGCSFGLGSGSGSASSDGDSVAGGGIVDDEDISGLVVGTENGVMYCTREDVDFAIAVGGNGTEKHLKIASTYKGKPVTAIDPYGYNEARIENEEDWAEFANGFWGNILSVEISESVTSIGDWAFIMCDDLTSVTIPDSVTSIGDYAFSYCSSLTSVEIDGGVTSIGDGAFNDCTSLKSLMIPDSVTNIGDGAFNDCTSLKSLMIPDSVTNIGDGVFEDCNNLQYNVYDNAYYLGNENNPYIALIKAKSTDITSCDIYENTKIIYQYAFYECFSLTSVEIPDGVTSIGYEAFYACISLQYNKYDNAYYLGNANNPYMVLIGKKSKDIASCEIHKNTKIIYCKAFWNCSNLMSMEIPDSVTSIGDIAFWDCSNLTSVEIPDSVMSIGDSAFSGCSSLMRVEIPDRVTSIGSYAFSGCSSLMSVVIGDSAICIGDRAFRGCSGLRSATFKNPNGWCGSKVDVEHDEIEGPRKMAIDSTALSDPATAVMYLTDMYYGYYWKRS